VRDRVIEEIGRHATAEDLDNQQLTHELAALLDVEGVEASAHDDGDDGRVDPRPPSRSRPQHAGE